jgi:hypothetical protein
VYHWCPDKMSRDITSGDIKHTGTKHLEGKNVRRDKMSGGTKCPEGQNVRRDKMSGGTKRPADKTSVGTKRAETYIRGTKHPCGENVRRDKTSGDKMSIWVIFLRSMLGNIFTEKSIDVKEKSAKTIPSLSQGWGEIRESYTTVKSSKTFNRGPLYLAKQLIFLLLHQ